MADALNDVLDRLTDVRERRLDAPECVWLSRHRPEVKELLGEGNETAAGKLWGIPLVVSEMMPKNMGMMRSRCRCSYVAVVQDGGELMHEAKRHTVILKFEE